MPLKSFLTVWPGWMGRAVVEGVKGRGAEGGRSAETGGLRFDPAISRCLRRQVSVGV